MSIQYYPHFDRIVETECGKIRGIAGADPKFTVYRGIPYAKPPVGQLRWKKPQPIQPWEGVKDCLEFGNIAPQGNHPVNSLYGKEFFQHNEIRSEDCLYLNIWTPSMGGNEKMPVLFWVHGGGLSGGYSSEPEFDGEAFCREGVILVTGNYRLGILGFYANSELVKEEGTAGNYGHMDQIAAFHWVRRNIAAFGGDPDRITIFGQSAGAASVETMCASPLTEGEIAGCIMMSCAGVAKPGTTGMWGRSPSLSEVVLMGDEFMKEAGCKNIDELRKLSYEELNNVPGMKGDFAKGIFPKYQFGTILDDYVIKESGPAMVYEGTMRDIPFMAGGTAGERKMFGDSMMINNRGFCECVLRAGHRAPYLYLFDHDLPGSSDGSFHSSELWYVFGTIHRSWRPMTGEDFDLSRIMTKAWANFAKQGNPNGEGVPEWEPYTLEKHCHMIFDKKSRCEVIAQTPELDNKVSEAIQKI